MPIPTKCSKCGRTYNVRDELAGQTAKCLCGEAVSVPERSGVMDLLDEDLATAGATLDSGPTGTGQTASPLLPTPRGRKRNPNAVLIAAVVGGCLVGILLIGVLVYMFSGGGDPTVAGNTPTLDAPSSDPGSPPLSPGGPASPPPPPRSGGSIQPTRSRKTAPRGPGYESPEVVFEAYKEAVIAEDTATLVMMLTPESVDDEVLSKIGRLCRSKSLPKAKEFLAQHGITEEVFRAQERLASRALQTPSPKPKDWQGIMKEFQDLSVEVEKKNEIYFNAVNDKYQFVIDARDYIAANREPLTEKGKRYKEARLKALAEAQLQDVRFRGDRAAGDVSFQVIDKKHERTHYFQQINGRWYLQTTAVTQRIPKKETPTAR